VLTGGKIDDYGNDLMFYRMLTGEVADGLAVVANSSPAMNVFVQPGTGRVSAGTAPNHYSVPFAIDTGGQGEQVTIATANSSNPRNDLIVAVVNAVRSTSVTNNVNISLSLLSVAGTPASSPADPNASAIQAAIVAAGGSSSDRYAILGRVRVNAGVTQITNSDITDLRSMLYILPFNPYMFHVYAGGPTTLAASLTTKIAFSSKEYDPSSMFNTTNSRATVVTPGRYEFDATVELTAGAGGEDYGIILFKNGVERKRGTRVKVGSITSNGVISLTGSFPAMSFVVNDYLEIYVYNGSGANKSVTAGQAMTYFGGTLKSVS